MSPIEATLAKLKIVANTIGAVAAAVVVLYGFWASLNAKAQAQERADFAIVTQHGKDSDARLDRLADIVETLAILQSEAPESERRARAVEKLHDMEHVTH